MGIGNVSAIYWTGSLFIAAGPLSKLATSPNGTTWTNIPSFNTNFNISATPTGIAYNGSIYMVVGTDYGTNGYCSTSTDGITWTKQTNFTGALYGDPFGVACVGSLFVVVSYN